ncbi:hypothetical protein EON63_09840 [archaeon]|nr:MAG: hypothetical protein EON63_09840 [archaeon]
MYLYVVVLFALSSSPLYVLVVPRVRKTLTTQLQALQNDLVPKESALHKAAEQIQVSVHAHS